MINTSEGPDGFSLCWAGLQLGGVALILGKNIIIHKVSTFNS